MMRGRAAVARRANNPEVLGSNPRPANKTIKAPEKVLLLIKSHSLVLGAIPVIPGRQNYKELISNQKIARSIRAGGAFLVGSHQRITDSYSVNFGSSPACIIYKSNIGLNK